MKRFIIKILEMIMGFFLVGMIVSIVAGNKSGNYLSIIFFLILAMFIYVNLDK